MKLHARFNTQFRGDEVEVEVIADITRVDAATRAEVEFTFWKNGEPHHVENLTRMEMADLCRQAAEANRHGVTQ